MPREPLFPPADRLTLKFDFGSLPRPWLWNGPPKLSVMGVVSVEEPEGLTVRLKVRLPLLTVWLPLNVCLSRLAASFELPPHEDRAKTRIAARRAEQAVRFPGIDRCITRFLTALGARPGSNVASGSWLGACSGCSWS